MTVGTIVLGDLNLDWSKHFDNNYNLKNYFVDMDEKLENHNQIQIIELPTLSNYINGRPCINMTDKLIISQFEQIEPQCPN